MREGAEGVNQVALGSPDKKARDLCEIGDVSVTGEWMN